MLELKVELPLEYGVVYLADSQYPHEIPGDAGHQTVSHSDTCVYLSLMSYVDGNSTIYLSNNSNYIFENGSEYVLKILCNSKVLCLYDHNGFKFACIPVSDTTVELNIELSHSENPETAFIRIDSISYF